MARKPTPPNELGAISLTELPDGKYRAKARMWLQDRTRQDPVTGAFLGGKRVDITVTVPTDDKARARAALKVKAEERILRALRDDAGAVKARRADLRMTVAEAASTVLASLADTDEVTESSLYVYELHVKRHLAVSDLGVMQVAQVQPLDVRAYLALIAAEVGVATARAGRAVLHRVFRYAVDSGLRTDDPSVGVRILAPRKADKTKSSPLDHQRALTPAERVTLAWAVAQDRRAVDLDLRDLVLAGLAIGGRIGEMLAVRWADVEFTDDGKARVTLAATVDWVRGAGLQRRPPKTESSVRTVPVPRRVAALLRRRARAAGVDLAALGADERPVFPHTGRGAPGVGFRDRSNATTALRGVFDRSGFGWASYHTLRRSAGTALADALPVRVAADYLGHASIRTTLDHYVGRSAVVDRVADYL